MTAPVGALPLVIASALKSAAGRAGVSFDFMVRTAARESGFDAAAKAAGSSAAGLFQFVEQTWLSMVSRHGAAHGLAREAGAIAEDASGHLKVADKAERQRILDLRLDPQIAAQMAGELTRENAATLQQHLGRKPKEAELYVAHFMGAGKAAALINAAAITPGARAATLFPKEAQANRAIFYGRQGQARSVAEVLGVLQSSHDAPPSPASSPRPPGAAAPRSLARVWRAVSAPSSAAFGSQALRLTPAIIEILSSFSAPAGATRSDDNQPRDRNPAQV